MYLDFAFEIFHFFFPSNEAGQLDRQVVWNIVEREEGWKLAG
jgi:hypothetical protein